MFDFEQSKTQIASKIVKIKGFNSGTGFVIVASK